MNLDDYITRTELAKKLKISVDTIRRWEKLNTFPLPILKLSLTGGLTGKNQPVRYPMKAVEKFLEENTIRPKI